MHPGDDKVAKIATKRHTRDKSQITNKVVQQQRSTENNITLKLEMSQPSFGL